MTAAQLGVAREDRLELLDRRLQLGELVAQLLALELGEAAQLHVEDVVRPGSRRTRTASAIRPGAGGLDVGRAPDQGDDRVDHVERLHQALDDVRAVLAPCAGGTRCGGVMTSIWWST